MTVSSTSSKSPVYTGNGTTGPWTFSFKTFAASELEVIQADAAGAETVLTLTTDYTVSLNADQNNDPGGEVTTVVAVPNDGSTIVVRWAGQATQGLDLQTAGGFYPEAQETAFDKLSMLVQQVQEEAARAVKVSISSGDDPDALVADLFAAEAAASASASAASASAASAAADAATVANEKLVWQGAYSAATTYAENDAVGHDGSSYISKADGNLGHAPPNATWWDTLAAKGTPGAGTGDMLGANNLSDVANAATSRANLGLGDAATKNTGTSAGTVAAGDHNHTGVYEPAGSSTLPMDSLYGCTLSNNTVDATNDIDIGAGRRRDSTDVDNMVLASALTKRLDAAWAVGTNQGGLDTGAVANGTYHVWLIKRSDTGAVDALFSLSATAPTMPTSYDRKRRIGSIIRSGGAILGFIQTGQTFRLKTPVRDVNATSPGTTAVTRTLTVPTGVKMEALVASQDNANSGTPTYATFTYLSDLDSTDSAPSMTVAPFTHSWAQQDSVAAMTKFSTGPVAVVTNTSSQIRSRTGQSGTPSGWDMQIFTYGWTDYRQAQGA